MEAKKYDLEKIKEVERLANEARKARVVKVEEDDDEQTGSCANPICRKYLYNSGEYCDSRCEYEDNRFKG